MIYIIAIIYIYILLAEHITMTYICQMVTEQQMSTSAEDSLHS